MVGRRRAAGVRGGSARRNAAADDGKGESSSDIYSQMLEDAGMSSGVALSSNQDAERPLKKRKTAAAQKDESAPEEPHQRDMASQGQDDKDFEDWFNAGGIVDDEDEDFEFEDVALPLPTMQTMERDSEDDGDDGDEGQSDDFDFGAPLRDEPSPNDEPQSLDLNLTAEKAATTPSKRQVNRQRPLTRQEKDRRIDIHKVHLLCLLSHVARRNHWCNDVKVQDALRPHLTDKAVKYLTPGAHLPQFGRAESLKNGLRQVEEMWRNKFEVTERGLRRSLWAEEVEHLQEYEPPSDMDSCLDRQEFRDEAKKLQGSRDVGAQLYCAMLRSIGVRVRLVCSLQPLTFSSNGPTLPEPKAKRAQTTPNAKAKKNEEALATLNRYKVDPNAANSSPSGATARRRLGHPSAAAFNFEPTRAPSQPKPTFSGRKYFGESTYPVYWVEILDVGHQKWQPVDPVVTHTFWKPRVLEPPITDKKNSMTYVVAFEEDGTAKDVTRRYAKAYTAKTRKSRIETAVESGDRWWRKALKPFRRQIAEDLDQIENTELQSIEAREPMPKNVQDFKDHPVYALERHLRRHEVLAPNAMPSGTVGAGSRGPLEKIYRRKDVRSGKTVDKWYRSGRDVRPNEIPAKWLPKRARPKRGRFGDSDEEDDDDGLNGVPIYTLDQTDPVEVPPIRNGRVPKNKFGNVDVYVPSMIPPGGVHIDHEHAARASFILGIDYAPALTGFSFKGRHGTAVLSGVVVATEYAEAVYAVIDGLGDAEREAEEERRRGQVLKQWRRWMMGLRIRERVWAGANEEERREAEREVDERVMEELDGEDMGSDVTEEFDMDYDEEDVGGGFMVE